MKKPILIICAALLLAAALATTLIAAGCGGKTESNGTTPSEVEEEGMAPGEVESSSPEGASTTEEEDRETLEEMLDEEAAKSEDFDHNKYERVTFAEDSDGMKWALVEVETFTKSSPDEGTTGYHVFKQDGDTWTQVSSGTSGYSEGVPEEVQKQLDIEGQ